jgi:flagellar hook-associated protein 2
LAVKQIIEAESEPLRQLESHKAREETKMKLFQEFKGKFSGINKALGDMANFKSFRELKADLGDGSGFMSVTLDKDKAQPGSYQVQIDQLAQRTSVISNGFEDPDEPVMGLGFVVMNREKGENAEIFVDDNQSSLHGIANLINNERDVPVHAAVIKDASDDEAPWKLILTAKKDGASNAIEFPQFYFLDGSKDFYIDDDHEAKNAIVKIDGFPVELESNDISEFLPGVNLHLKQARPDQPFTITITEDYQKVSGKLKGLVDQLNGVLDFIVKQNQIDEKSDTRTTFAGDSGLQTVEYRIRNLMHEGFYVPDKSQDSGYRLVFMNQLGVEFDRSGSLTFKEDHFQKELEKDFDGVSDAITGEFGFAYQLRSVIDGYTRPGNGLLAVREQGLRSRIKEIDSQIEQKTAQIDRRQQSLTDQYARLESSLANLQRQQQYLSASLPGAGGGGNLVQQLLGG